jgi:hypothetical protein
VQFCGMAEDEMRNFSSNDRVRVERPLLKIDEKT